MKKIILLSLLATIVICSNQILTTQYPNPSEKIITFNLSDNLKTNATLNQLGTVQMQIGLYSLETYFTSAQCSNCQVYGDKEGKPFECNQEDYCSSYQQIEGTVDQYFKAQGDLINMSIILDSVEFYLSQGMYVKWISQLFPNQTYHYQGIGLGLTRAVQSPFIRSLYQQSKIDEFSYSLSYSGDQYHLILGGYNQSLLAQEFYNLKSVFTMRNVPLKIDDELVLGLLYFNGQMILKDAHILLDPTIDGIILPSQFYNQYNIQTILQNQRKIPEISPFTVDSPGIWSSLKSAPTFSILFYLDDPDAISQYLQVNFDAQTFNNKNEKGHYSPKLSFYKLTNEYSSVVRVGKILFKQMVYYKLIQDMGSNPTEFRGLAPMKSQ